MKTESLVQTELTYDEVEELEKSTVRTWKTSKRKIKRARRLLKTIIILVKRYKLIEEMGEEEFYRMCWFDQELDKAISKRIIKDEPIIISTTVKNFAEWDISFGMGKLAIIQFIGKFPLVVAFSKDKELVQFNYDMKKGMNQRRFKIPRYL